MHVMSNVPGFVNLFCTFQDVRNLYFVMSFEKNGDLLPYINKVGSFDLKCKQFYAAELIMSLESLHKRGIIHRDLKPDSNETDYFKSIRMHPFFDGIKLEGLRQQTPPKIFPYLPGVNGEEEELLRRYNIPDHLEPGLDDRQLTRLLGLELGTSMPTQNKDESKNLLNIPEHERQRLLVEQKLDKWHQFVDDEVIIKQGFVNKRKGLFARNFYQFDFPNRTYYLEDPQGFALDWCHTMKSVHTQAFGDQT